MPQDLPESSVWTSPVQGVAATDTAIPENVNLAPESLANRTLWLRELAEQNESDIAWIEESLLDVVPYNWVRTQVPSSSFSPSASWQQVFSDGFFALAGAYRYNVTFVFSCDPVNVVDAQLRVWDADAGAPVLGPINASNEGPAGTSNVVTFSFEHFLALHSPINLELEILVPPGSPEDIYVSSATHSAERMQSGT